MTAVTLAPHQPRTPPAPWSSPGYAVQSEDAVVDSGALGFTLPHRMLGGFRATAAPTGPTGGAGCVVVLSVRGT